MSFYNITRQQCGRNVHDVIFVVFRVLKYCCDIHLELNGKLSCRVEIHAEIKSPQQNEHPK